MWASITEMAFWPEHYDGVRGNFENFVGPMHQQLIGHGLVAFYFMASKEEGKGVGIAIWDDEQKMLAVEGAHTLAEAIAADTDYSRIRSDRLKAINATITALERFPVIGAVTPSFAAGLSLLGAAEE
jgi:hypothetical protein